MNQKERRWLRVAAIWAIFFAWAPPAAAQFEPPVETDWRLVLVDQRIGLVEYLQPGRRTHVRCGNNFSFALPLGIELSAFVLLLSLGGIIFAPIVGISGAMRYAADRKNSSL